MGKREKMKLYELVLLSQVNSQWMPPAGAGAGGGAPPLLPDGMRLPPRGVSMAAPPAFPGAPVAMGAPPPMMPGFPMAPNGRFGMAMPPQAAFPGAPVAFPGAPVAMGVAPPLPPGVQMSPT